MRSLPANPTLPAVAVLALLACGPAVSRDSQGGAPAAATDTSHWKSYVDRSHGFSLRYPDSMVILPESGPLPERRPPIVYRVRFMDRHLAASAGAFQEPPQLTVEVFAASNGPLRSWLSAYERMAPGSEPERISATGAREGLRVRDRRQTAPNEFIYFATRDAVIAVIPLGTDGEVMAASFALAAEK